MRKRVGEPGRLLQVMRPPWPSTVARHRDRPRPMPSSPLVVKNGWNRRIWTSGGMGSPVFSTSMVTCSCVGGGAHGHVAALGRGLQGVAHQVHDGLVQAEGVGLDAGARPQIGHQLALAGQRVVAAEGHRQPDHLVGVDRLLVVHLGPALGVAADLVQHGVQRADAGEGVAQQLVQAGVAPVGARGHQGVEVLQGIQVGGDHRDQALGDAAQGGQALGVAGALLGLAQLGQRVLQPAGVVAQLGGRLFQADTPAPASPAPCGWRPPA